MINSSIFMLMSESNLSSMFNALVLVLKLFINPIKLSSLCLLLVPFFTHYIFLFPQCFLDFHTNHDLSLVLSLTMILISRQMLNSLLSQLIMLQPATLIWFNASRLVLDNYCQSICNLPF